MTRDFARRVRALECAAPQELSLSVRKWFGETLTPEEEIQLLVEPETEPLTAAQWDAWPSSDRVWFEERGVGRPSV
jgi:hypothetical protein